MGKGLMNYTTTNGAAFFDCHTLVYVLRCANETSKSKHNDKWASGTSPGYNQVKL